MGRSLIEQTGQISEIRHEHADGSFVERDGHVSISPAGTTAISGLIRRHRFTDVMMLAVEDLCLRKLIILGPHIKLPDRL